MYIWEEYILGLIMPCNIKYLVEEVIYAPNRTANETKYEPCPAYCL